DAERRAPKKAEKPAEPAKTVPQTPKEVPQAPKAERAPKPERPQKPARPKTDSAEQAPKAERGPKPERIEKPARAPKAEKPLLSRMPSEPAVPAEKRDPQSDEGKVQTFLQELTRLMGLEISVHVHTDEEGNIRVSMQGDTLGILIGRRGETLDALQYLTSLHINRGRQEYTRVTLDSEGYRAKREDALVRLANRMANRAQRTGRKVSLEPMNPYERRILHSALQGHEGISTHSEGEEPNRHVVITVSRDAKPVQGSQSDEEE
ncbi:MAG: RNA-binding cell elongation regulator Jag/EloR, partial [Eubacteriales bacterium]